MDCPDRELVQVLPEVRVDVFFVSGYHIWAESLYKPLVKIFRKYGIKP